MHNAADLFVAIVGLEGLEDGVARSRHQPPVETIARYVCRRHCLRAKSERWHKAAQQASRLFADVNQLMCTAGEHARTSRTTHEPAMAALARGL